MTATPKRHQDVAAYVLGVLEGADSDAFEAHLACCPRCTEEAEQLGPAAQRLSILGHPISSEFTDAATPTEVPSGHSASDNCRSPPRRLAPECCRIFWRQRQRTGAARGGGVW